MNDEARTTNYVPDRCILLVAGRYDLEMSIGIATIPASSFGLLSSFAIRHSSF